MQRHYRWLQLSASLEEVGRPDHSRESALPGSEPDGGRGGGALPLSKGWNSLQPLPESSPPRSCPVTIPWDTLPRDPAKTRAAVFTPYNVVSWLPQLVRLAVVGWRVLHGLSCRSSAFHCKFYCRRCLAAVSATCYLWWR